MKKLNNFECFRLTDDQKQKTVGAGKASPEPALLVDVNQQATVDTFKRATEPIRSRVLCFKDDFTP